jgi:hypothetical protein
MGLLSKTGVAANKDDTPSYLEKVRLSRNDDSRGHQY